METFVSTGTTGTTGATGATAGAGVTVDGSAVQLRGPLVALALATSVAWSPKSQQAVESSGVDAVCSQLLSMRKNMLGVGFKYLGTFEG